MDDLLTVLNRARQRLAIFQDPPSPDLSRPAPPAPESEADRIDRVLAGHLPSSSQHELYNNVSGKLDSFWQTLKGAAATKIPGMSQLHDLADEGADWVGDKLTSSGMDSPVGARARLFGDSFAHSVADLVPGTVGGAAMMAAPAVAMKGAKAGLSLLKRGAGALSDMPVPEFSGGSTKPARKLLSAFESSGAETDPLDTRFASRPQGTTPADLSEPDPFTHTPQPSGADTDPLSRLFGSRRQGITPSDLSEPTDAVASRVTRFEPSGADVDPTDTRFSSRRQGVLPEDTGERDPFARASQADFSDVPDATSDPAADATGGDLGGGEGKSQAERLRSLYRLLGADDAASMRTPTRRYVTETGPPEAPLEIPTAEDVPVLQVDDAESRRVGALVRSLRGDDAEATAIGKRRYAGESGPPGAPPARTASAAAVPDAAGDVENPTVVAVRNLYNRMRPKFDAANASAPEVPFDVDPEPFPDFYQRVLTDDPRQLMGPERAVRSELDSSHPEAGFVDPKAIAEGLPKVAQQAEKLRYFAMLANLPPQLKNVLGNIGMVMGRSGEELLQGNVRQAGNVAKQFFNPQTAREFVREFKNPAPGRWGTPEGVLGLPGRSMGAVDAATKDSLGRAGYDKATSELITATNDPRSGFGQWLTEGASKSVIRRLLVPFARTSTNLAERGIERTPIAGMLPSVAKMTGANPGEVIARQVLGTGATLEGYQSGKHNAQGKKGVLDNPYVQALLGPYALPAELGYAMGKVAGKPSSDTGAYDIAKGGYDALVKSLPITSDAYQFDPRSVLASFMPGAPKTATDLANEVQGKPPSQYFTAKHTLPREHRALWPLAPTIAKIPWLRDMLLKQKRVRRED